ncbi:MAG: CHAP domain-containing protein [Acidobacteriota bacterium]|nr:CHAP domain-containing protein [Acidobacteriota bacterium]
MNPEVEGGLRLPPRGSSAARASLLAGVACTVAALALAWTGAARADPSQLCAGYAPCSVPGLTTHGYEQAANRSWWSMYAGINCTNYAAYVESQVYGVPTPSLLLGDAGQWGERAAAAGIPVDQTPTVGSVAVWGAGAPGMGGYGHVGVVETIGPGGSYIDVSQSGMGTANDGYDWERVYRDNASWESWPASFIHFAGAASPSTLPHPGARLPGAVLVAAGG